MERQHGVAAAAQLKRLGLGKEAIKYRVRVGRLHRVHRGVYSLVPPSLLSVKGRWMAAVLACGRGAVLSHRDGARHHGVWSGSRREIDVTAARSREGLRGVTLHRSRALIPPDWGWKDNIPVTSPARTFLDCAEVLRPRQLTTVLEEAERIRIFDLTAIKDVLERNKHRRGHPVLIACLGLTLEEAQYTKRELERLLLAICAEAGLPLPAFNTMVEGYEVDAHWPGTIVIVELDSWEFHRTRAAFERDRSRDLRLEAAGYTVVRLTWRQLTERRAEVIQTLRALLDSGRTLPARDPGAPARAWPSRSS
jgi:Transcriptional regulator, AbiEi antitoxin/Protein of unknown function (DUF559)